jgi:hypothetical protein
MILFPCFPYLQWAFVFVGVYGYSFSEAGFNVISLFKTRGWSVIITDSLVDTVLVMVSICVGIFTGIVGVSVASALGQGASTLGAAFILGMLIGVLFSMTLFGLVSSGVNTVIVMFAESPAEFAQNHPTLSQEMLVTWRGAYPSEFGY